MRQHMYVALTFSLNFNPRLHIGRRKGLETLQMCTFMRWDYTVVAILPPYCEHYVNIPRYSHVIYVENKQYKYFVNSRTSYLYLNSELSK